MRLMETSLPGLRLIDPLKYDMTIHDPLTVEDEEVMNVFLYRVGFVEDSKDAAGVRNFVLIVRKDGVELIQIACLRDVRSMRVPSRFEKFVYFIRLARECALVHQSDSSNLQAENSRKRTRSTVSLGWLGDMRIGLRLFSSLVAHWCPVCVPPCPIPIICLAVQTVIWH